MCLDARHVARLANERHRPRWQLSDGADDFRVALVTDQDDLLAFCIGAFGFAVDLGNQRAGRVDKLQIPALGFFWHGLRHAVGGENHRAVVGCFVQLVNEDGALGFQTFDHKAIVYDLMAHIDRRAVLLQRQLDDVDGANDARAEPSGGGKFDGQRWLHVSDPLFYQRDRSPRRAMPEPNDGKKAPQQCAGV